MKSLSLVILCLLSFSACASKPQIEVVYEKVLVCNMQETLERPKVALRVKKEDANLALKFKEALNAVYGFYEKQVEQNNKLCKEKK